jgi:hypothetical protein
VGDHRERSPTAARSILYDGAPDYPDADRLWAFVERHRVNVLGVSPTLSPRADGARATGRCARTTVVPADAGVDRRAVERRAVARYFECVGEGRCR